jgi:cyclase
MDPSRQAEVARLFRESDETPLPAMLGVTGRWLFSFHDLYFHLVEAEPGLADRIAAMRTHSLFTDLSEKLNAHIGAYDPTTWRSPADAMASVFYAWQRTGRSAPAVDR